MNWEPSTRMICLLLCFLPMGNPLWPAFRLTRVAIMQFVEGLSDRQAADVVRTGVDGKYPLSLELEDSGFYFSLLE